MLRLATIFLLFTTVAHAQLSVAELELKQEGRYFCALSSTGRWYAGKLSNSGETFTPYSKLIASVKKKLKRARGKVKTKLTKLLRSYKTQKNIGDAICNGEELPSPSPTPAPTSTPSNSNPFFTSNGDMTSHGKGVLGIPASFSANITRGREVHSRLCAGCHGERGSGRSFDSMRQTTSSSPMLYDSTQLPNGDLADLMAFLNRFRS